MEWTVEQYIPIADMIAKTFGENCEVVIHDLSTPQNSVVYTVNGHVTGRKVGQSFDHLIKQVLLNQSFSNDFAANYYFQTEDGRMIKSSTVLLRNSEGTVSGALCINMDTTVLTSAASLLANLLPRPANAGLWFECGGSKVDESGAFNKNDKTEKAESDAHIMEIAEELIGKIVGDRDVDGMKRDERIELIRFMDVKGVFLIKGSVEKVAKRMGISKVTVYSYLDEIKEEKGLK